MISKRIQFLLGLSIIILTTSAAFADIIHLKSGKTFEGVVEEAEGGYWIDGIFFSNEEVFEIEKRPISVEITPPPAQEKVMPARRLPRTQEGWQRTLKITVAQYEHQSEERTKAVLARIEPSLPMLLLVVLAAAGVYFLGVLPIYLIARKLQITHAWAVWVPVLQFFAIVRMAGKTWVWGLMFFILMPLCATLLAFGSMFLLPAMGGLFFIFGFICVPVFLAALWVYVWMRITAACGKPAWYVLALLAISLAGAAYTFYAIFMGKTPILGDVLFWDGFDVLLSIPAYFFLWYLAFSKTDVPKKEETPVPLKGARIPPSPQPPSAASDAPPVKTPPPYRG